jgi:hypothetical protein
MAVSPASALLGIADALQGRPTDDQIAITAAELPGQVDADRGITGAGRCASQRPGVNSEPDHPQAALALQLGET